MEASIVKTPRVGSKFYNSRINLYGKFTAIVDLFGQKVAEILYSDKSLSSVLLFDVKFDEKRKAFVLDYGDPK